MTAPLRLKRDGVGTGRYLTLDGRYGIGIGDDTWRDANGTIQGEVDWTVYRTDDHELGEDNIHFADTLRECREWLAGELNAGRLT